MHTSKVWVRFPKSQKWCGMSGPMDPLTNLTNRRNPRNHFHPRPIKTTTVYNRWKMDLKLFFLMSRYNVLIEKIEECQHKGNSHTYIAYFKEAIRRNRQTMCPVTRPERCVTKNANVYVCWCRLSRLVQSWRGLFVFNDVSTSLAVVIFNVALHFTLRLFFHFVYIQKSLKDI